MDVSGGKLSDVLSLTTAKLTLQSNISLVERAEINKILAELKLSSSQLVSRESALKLGRLLRADGLVFLSLSNNEKIIRVRLVDTKYGLRLLDTLAEWGKVKWEV